MSTPGLHLCLHALDANGLKEIVEAGIDDEFLDGEAATVFRFIRDFQIKYTALPTQEVVEKKTGIKLKCRTLPILPYVIDEVREEHRVRLLSQTIRKSVAFIEEGEPKKAWDELTGLVVGSGLDAAVNEDLLSYGPGIDEFLDYYDAREFASSSNTMIGIPTPWSYVNETLRGFQAGQLITLVARPKTGKTFVLCLIAAEALRAKKKVLFISMEMSRREVRSRVMLFYENISITKYQDGKLGSFAKKKLREFAEKTKNGELPEVRIKTPDQVATDRQVAKAIIDHKPDIVLLDGLYILSTSQKFGSNWERIMHIVTQLKQYAQRFHVPIITTTQFNRQQKQTSIRGSINDIAFSDSIGMFCDLVIGLFRDDALIKKKLMLFRTLAAREMTPFDWVGDWDLDAMKFDVVEKLLGPYDGGNTGPTTSGKLTPENEKIEIEDEE